MTQDLGDMKAEVGLRYRTDGDDSQQEGNVKKIYLTNEVSRGG